MPRHFHSLRVAQVDCFPVGDRPLIVCINHPSWWDPLTILLLCQFLAPQRFAHAPMEAEALAHYGFFRRLGAFPVDNKSTGAGAQFLRQARAVLQRGNSILWMTPEGNFVDARHRPILWKAGTAALTRVLDSCTVVPLAIEYTFWNERLPEILCAVGEPLRFASTGQGDSAERTALLQAAMTETQQHLASLAMRRDASLFTPVFAGRAGVNSVYDLWQRAKSALRGKPYVAEHGTIAPK